MTETRSDRRPRRDANGRLASAGDLIGTALAAWVGGVVVWLLLEGVLALAGVSGSSSGNGWLVLLPAVFLFIDEFRRAGYGGHRVLAAGAAAALGLLAGLLLSGLVTALHPMILSGAIGAAGSVVVYCLVWFYGLRWLDRRAA
jgi:hypothetical protein